MRRVWPCFFLAALIWLWPVNWSLWTDEFFTAGLASRKLAGVVDGAAKDRHPPLYFLVVWGFARFGVTDAWLRVPSGLATLGAMALTASAARRHTSRHVATVVAAWFATSAVPACFAHTARMYAMALLAGAAMTWGALEATADDEHRARRGRWVLAGAAILGFWTHYATLLVAAAAFAAVGAAQLASPSSDREGGADGGTIPRDRLATRSVTPLLATAVAVALGCAPWILGPFRTQFAEKDPTVPFAWEVWRFFWWSADDALRPLSFVAAILAVAGAAVLTVRGGRLRVVAAAFVAAMIVLPALASTNLPARLARNYVGFFPVCALFAGVAIDVVARRLAAAFRGGASVGEWLGAGIAVALSAPLSVAALTARFHPQDVNGGHDYRLEAQVLDRIIPADAAVAFTPAYTVEQVARYAPALRERAARGGGWRLTASGGKGAECLFVHAFRLRLAPPAQACASVRAGLFSEADRTAYPGLLLERLKTEMDGGDTEGAARDVARLLPQVPDWPMVHTAAGWIAEKRGDNAAALAEYAEALRLARAFEPAGKVVAEAWRRVARIHTLNNDIPAAEHAKAAMECARTREPDWACGGPLAWATRAAVP